VNTEITDNNAKKPVGWIFFDAECRFCRATRQCCGAVFERRRYAWLPLQTPGAIARLRLSEAELLAEMKLLLADGRVLGGLAAWTVLLRSVWWLWPLGVLFGLPGIRWFSNLAYGWIARHRHCFGDLRKSSDPKSRHRRHSAFFEMP